MFFVSISYVSILQIFLWLKLKFEKWRRNEFISIIFQSILYLNQRTSFQFSTRYYIFHQFLSTKFHSFSRRLMIVFRRVFPLFLYERVRLWSLQASVSDCALIGGCCRNMDTLSPLSLSLLLLSIHNERKLPTREWVGAFWGCTWIQDESRVPMSNSLNNRDIQAMLRLFCNVSHMIVQIYVLLLNIVKYSIIQRQANLCWKLTFFSTHRMM